MIEWVIGCLGGIILLILISFSRSKKLKSNPIPLVEPSVPLLGNALDYKKAPDEYLVKQSERYGGIFRINLAGMETTILTSDGLLRQFDQASENVLSSRAAVADLGFAYTLGNLNVFTGTDLHKEIIKNYVSSASQTQHLTERFTVSIRKALAKEFNRFSSPMIPDFLLYIRRVILTVIIDEFISPQLFEYYAKSAGGDFLSDFMTLQDEIETATATAAVLPLWLALPACLWKCEKNRLRLSKKLEDVLRSICRDIDSGNLSAENGGIWLKALRNRSPPTTLSDIAELFIGLLFAAHKNPAIASAQSILFLLETSLQGDSLPLSRSYEDADSMNEEYILRVVYETLRLTAHSIGAMRKVVSEEGWSIVLEDGRQAIIPTGNYVGVSHIVPHRDSKKWGSDCALFRPDRKDLLDQVKNIRSFTVFSSGVHICPGRHIALMMIQLVVKVFLCEYELREDMSKHVVTPISFEKATLAQRQGPCKILVRSRRN